MNDDGAAVVPGVVEDCTIFLAPPCGEAIGPLMGDIIGLGESWVC